MMLYELRVDAGKFASLVPVEDEVDVFIDGFAGRPMADEWIPPTVRILPEDLSAGRLVSDFPNLSGAVVVMSARAADALSDVLDGGELLPLASVDGEYWAFNPLTVLDALDEARSDGEYVAPGRLLTLRRFVPRADVDRPLPPVFKIPQWLKGRALVTQAFVDAVVDNGLTGLDPRPVGEV